MLLVASLCFMTGSPSLAQTSPGGDLGIPGDCGATLNYDVILLIDQSASLSFGRQATDPNDLRIGAAENLIGAFRELADETGARVRIAISGFGREYYPGLFMELSSGTASEAVDAVQAFATKDTDLDTDYVYALDGAATQFESLPDPSSCRLLVWFTDGEHDMHDSGPARTYDPEQRPLSLADEAAIESLLVPAVCGGLGDRPAIAGRLRSQGVTPVIVLLGRDVTDLREGSRRVLTGLPSSNACGTGSGGPPISVEDSGKLSFAFRCVGHALTGGFPIPVLVGPEGAWRWTPTSRAPLIDSYEIVLYGPVEVMDVQQSPPGDLVVEQSQNWSTVSLTGASPAAGFEVLASGVDDACGYLTFDFEVTVEPVTELREGERAQFVVGVIGAAGDRLSGSVLSELSLLESSVDGVPQGLTQRPDGWLLSVEQLPAREVTIEAHIELDEIGTLREIVDARFNVKPPPGYPSLTPDIFAFDEEGAGTFAHDVTIDGGDGGEVCITDTTPFPGTDVVLTFSGDACVAVGRDQELAVVLTMEFPSQRFLSETREVEMTSVTGERAPLPFQITIATDVRPIPDQNARIVIVATLMVLILLLLVGSMYLVQVITGRLPDGRQLSVVAFDAEQSEGGGYIRSSAVEFTDIERPVGDRSRLSLGNGFSAHRRVRKLIPWGSPRAIVRSASVCTSLFNEHGFKPHTSCEGPISTDFIALSQPTVLMARDPRSMETVQGVALFSIAQLSRRANPPARVFEDLVDSALDALSSQPLEIEAKASKKPGRR